MRAVAVDLDSRPRAGLRIGVAADMKAPVDDDDALAERGDPLGQRRAEEAGPDDQQVGCVQAHGQAVAGVGLHQSGSLGEKIDPENAPAAMRRADLPAPAQTR